LRPLEVTLFQQSRPTRATMSAKPDSKRAPEDEEAGA